MIAIAVDIGGTGTKLGVVNSDGDIRHFRRFQTALPADKFFQQLVAGVKDLLKHAPEAVGIGISVAGFIDKVHARMVYNPNIGWLEHLPLRDNMRRRFGLPVNLEVDSNAAALGEFHFGHGAGAKRLLCVTIGTGIGAGVVINGELLRFTHECVGDAGHIIVAPGTERCSCGGHGCAEALATAPAILKRAGHREGSLRDLAKDPQAEAHFTEAGNQLGILCASLSSIFFPDRILLGGGVVEASPAVVRAARETWNRYASDVVRRNAQLLEAKLGGKAPLAGAACPLLKPQTPAGSV